MPTITVEGPQRSDVEKKRNLVKALTDAAAGYYEMPKEIMVVLIKQNAPENVGVGGQLILDRKKP